MALTVLLTDPHKYTEEYLCTHCILLQLQTDNFIFWGYLHSKYVTESNWNLISQINV